MRSHGPAISLLARGPGLYKGNIDGGAGLGFFNCRASIEYWSLAPRRGACTWLEFLGFAASPCGARFDDAESVLRSTLVSQRSPAENLVMQRSPAENLVMQRSPAENFVTQRSPARNS